MSSLTTHFNLATPIDSAVFSAMGILIVLIEVAVILLAIWTFISLKAPPSLKWAVWIGMLFLVLSQIFGNLIVQNGLARVLDSETGEFIAEEVGSAYVFGSAGSIKVPHALTLHAVQVLPILALLLMLTNWSERNRVIAVLVAAAGYTALVLVSALQTFNARSMLDMSPLSLLGFTSGVIVQLGVFAVVLMGLRRSFTQAPPKNLAA